MSKIKQEILDLIRRIGGDESLLHLDQFGNFQYVESFEPFEVLVIATPESSAPWVDLFDTRNSRLVMTLLCDSTHHAAKIVKDYIAEEVRDAA